MTPGDTAANRVRTVSLADTPPQPWRNGGGSTQELLAGPDACAWQWRISVARITQDGPFSAYPGVQRWFVVLAGAGVALHTAQRLVHVTADSPPLLFDGADAPGCTLLDGATLDLNLMLRPSAGSGGLHRAMAGAPWLSSAPHRALFCTGAGHLQVDDEPAVRAPAMSLLHSTQGSGQAWRWFAGSPEATAWWLHFHPHAPPAQPTHTPP